LSPDRKQILKTWIAAALWIGLIAIESTSYLSSENTSRFLYPIFHFLLGLELERFDILHHHLRKIGHFVGYFALSLLLFRAWKATLHLPWAPPWAWRWCVIAFWMSVLVASLDEWHQTFLAPRTGRFADVVLDSSGALTAQLLIFLFLHWRSTRLTTSSAQ